MMKRLEYEKNLIQNFITSVEKHGGKEFLSSIILTGSFGRGEPTYTVDGIGNLLLKSDVEIALIFPDFSNKEHVEQLISKVSSEFQEDLNLMPISEKRVRKAYNFNFSIRIPKYKTIFTYDLFKGSKTIWGQDFIGTTNITLDDIDPYEAKRLVANRIGELIYLQDTASDDQKAYLRKQWKGKLMLAIVSAWLICEKKYVSSYHGQYDEIIESKSKVEKCFGDVFLEDYQQVFMFLRECGVAFEVPDERLKFYVSSINKFFKAKQIGMPKVNSFSRYVKCFVKYVKSGMKYGLVNYENGILQALIDEYAAGDAVVSSTADVWHRAMY